MSEANVLKKLRGEANVRSKNNGHEIGRFKKRADGWYQAECWKCKKTAMLHPAFEVGTHRVEGETLKDRCENEFSQLHV